MERNREVWLQALLSPDIEGGWSKRDPKADPGGATMRGITLATYSEYLNRQATEDELRKITLAECRNIAISMYWHPVGADMLYDGLDVMAADFAFNSGWQTAAKLLQELVGLTGRDVDGFVGPKTITAIRSKDPVQLLRDYNDVRMNYLESLDNWEENANGWSKRCRLIYNIASNLVKPKPGASAMATSPTFWGGIGTMILGVWPEIQVMLSDNPLDFTSNEGRIRSAFLVITGISLAARRYYNFRVGNQ